MWPSALAAEGGAGDDRDLLLEEEALGELLVVEAAARDAGEGVEGALRLDEVEAHLAAALDDQLAAAGVLADHAERVLFAALQRLDGGVLGGGGSGHHDVLVHLHHRVDQARRGADPAEAPAGHRVGLREAAEEDRALLHARDRREADVLDAVDEAVVDLVRDDEEVVALDDVGDRLEAGAVHDGAGGVRRIAEEHRLRLVGDRRFEVAGVELEAVRCGRRHLHELAAGEDDGWHIGDVARVGRRSPRRRGRGSPASRG